MIQTLTESKFVRIALAATVLLTMGLAGPAAADTTVDASGDSAAALSGLSGTTADFCIGEYGCYSDTIDEDGDISVIRVPQV
jgi:hypothetical protein